MKQFKITIITAVYNALDTLEQAILSVLEQTYPNIEYIIIDGGSTDGSVELIKKYSSRIYYWVSEPDRGIYNAFNKGIYKATGDYVYFLGADDCLFSKDIISKVVEELIGGIDLLSAGVMAVDSFRRIQGYVGHEKINKQCYQGGMIPHQGMFVIRSLLNEYPFDENYKITSDYNFFLTCYYDEKVKIKYIHLPVAYYDIGGYSGNRDNNKRMLEENQRIHEKFNLPPVCNLNKKHELVKKLFGLFNCEEPVTYLYRKYINNWQQHKCNWENCRWCKCDLNK